jgi:hypothetical protein
MLLHVTKVNRCQLDLVTMHLRVFFCQSDCGIYSSQTLLKLNHQSDCSEIVLIDAGT